MATFRRNHESQSGGFMIRMMLIAVFLFGITIWWGSRSWPVTETKDNTLGEVEYEVQYPLDDRVDQIVDHTHFSLGYDEESEQASWVAYLLTREQLSGERVPRTDYFEEDPLVLSRSCHHRDYIRSGYTRGHLVPAADRRFSEEAMAETFYMSNISPQLRAFNTGIWRELEEHVRDWARDREEVMVFTGPVLNGSERYIGKTSQVTVPESFYKVVFDPDSNEPVAFLIPNQMSTLPLEEFNVSVNEVEAVTGIDFLKDLVPETEEEDIEDVKGVDTWPMDPSKYRKRVEEWNHR